MSHTCNLHTKKRKFVVVQYAIANRLKHNNCTSKCTGSLPIVIATRLHKKLGPTEIIWWPRDFVSHLQYACTDSIKTPHKYVQYICSSVNKLIPFWLCFAYQFYKNLNGSLCLFSSLSSSDKVDYTCSFCIKKTPFLSFVNAHTTLKNYNQNF